MRSVRRASRSSARASRASHFFLTMASSRALLACVAERSAEALAAPAVFEVVEDGVLAVLVFGGESRTAGGAFLRALVEDAAAGFGDAVGEVAADFGGEGQHAAKDFSERGYVVLRDPLGEPHEFVGEQRGFVEDLLDWLDFDAGGRRVAMHADDHAHQALAAEGNEDARSDDGRGAVHFVGEGLVERDGKGYVAVRGHQDSGHVQSNSLTYRGVGWRDGARSRRLA